MPLNDPEVRNSPAWWMKNLSDRQGKRLRDTNLPDGNTKPGLNTLAAWLENNPPLPEGAPAWQPAYQAFHKDTRTNVAALAVSSVRDRLTPLGFRTAAVDDDNGDSLASEVWDGNRMPVQQVDLLTWVFGLGSAYTMVGPPKPGSRHPIITVEDPRQVITSQDPLQPWVSRAGIKTLHDEDEGIDSCYVYLPPGPDYDSNRVTVYRAWRPAKRGSLWGENFRYAGRQSWTWDEPTYINCSRLPIVPIINRDGVAEFEPHLSILGRINRITLQRMMIGEIQAFRQRAVEGLPEFYPEDFPVVELRNKPIDYQGIFTPGPGSLWKVPAGVKFWESQPIDLRPLLDEERMEYRTASAHMGIPLYYFNPDDTNGSAEGASTQREVLIFRAEDRKTIVDFGLGDTMSLAFEMMGDTDRAQRSKIEGIWAPVERLSLTERFNAAVQAKASGLANATIRRYVLKMTPREMRQAQADDMEDMILGVSNQGPTPMEAIGLQQRQQPGPRGVPRETPAPAPAPVQPAA